MGKGFLGGGGKGGGGILVDEDIVCGVDRAGRYNFTSECCCGL